MDEKPQPCIWLIDDIAHWHEVTQRTLDLWGPHSFQGFYQVSSILMALDHTTGDALPEMILMDYFIDANRGDVVTRQIRTSFPEHDYAIIGYSTAASGSRAIVRAGGNASVAKHHDERGINPSLLQWLQSDGQTKAKSLAVILP